MLCCIICYINIEQGSNRTLRSPNVPKSLRLRLGSLPSRASTAGPRDRGGDATPSTRCADKPPARKTARAAGGIQARHCGGRLRDLLFVLVAFICNLLICFACFLGG